MSLAALAINAGDWALTAMGAAGVILGTQMWMDSQRFEELEEAMQRNRERTEHKDHTEFGPEYFKDSDGGQR